MLAHLPDSTFTNAVIPTVNKTWVHSNFTQNKTLDSFQCEHVVDKFWFLGSGNVGLIGTNAESHFNDSKYDTSIFSDVFTPTVFGLNNSTRAKNVMDGDCTDSGLNPGWFLRSAGSDGPNLVAVVGVGGSVFNYDTNGRLGIAPACTIG